MIIVVKVVNVLVLKLLSPLQCYMFFVDIDECQFKELCGEHTCYNNIGSYGCHCMDGFRNKNNLRECQGNRICHENAMMDSIFIFIFTIAGNKIEFIQGIVNDFME